MCNLRNRSFLKEIDFEPSELAFLLRAVRRAQDSEVRRHRAAPSRRQGDRADLREDLDPDARRVRGGRPRPGRARDLPRPDRFAARAQGVHRRHGARARSHVRRHRAAGQRPVRDRGAGSLRRRAGLQRPHRRVAPDPDAGRLPDDARVVAQALRRAHLRVRGRLPLQHGPLAPRHGRAHGRGRAPRRPGHAPTPGRRGDHRPGHRRADRRARSPSPTIRPRPCPAPTSSTPTYGCRWARTRTSGPTASRCSGPTR